MEQIAGERTSFMEYVLSRPPSMVRTGLPDERAAGLMVSVARLPKCKRRGPARRHRRTVEESFSVDPRWRDPVPGLKFMDHVTENIFPCIAFHRPAGQQCGQAELTQTFILLEARRRNSSLVRPSSGAAAHAHPADVA